MYSQLYIKAKPMTGCWFGLVFGTALVRLPKVGKAYSVVQTELPGQQERGTAILGRKVLNIATYKAGSL